MASVMQHKDKWIPWYFVAFFTVVAMVDAVMVTLAVETQPGLVTEHAYERGLAYNDTVKAAGMQDALGWKGAITSRTEGEKTMLSFRLQDARGLPIISQHVSVDLMRPVQEGIDFTMPMTRDEAGEYWAEAVFPARGVWQARVFVHDKGTRYQQSQRIVIK